MDRVRLGFIGVGGMGQCAHLRNYTTLQGDCEIVALAELRPQLGRLVAARYGVPKAYTDWRDMVATEKLDALICVQQFGLHGQLLPDILATGLPMLIEKPLASTVAAGEHILSSLAANPQAKLYLGYMKRSDPASIYARARIREWKEDGTVGPLRYARLTMPPGKWDMAGFSTLLKTDEPYPSVASDPPPADRSADWHRGYVEFVNYYIHQVNLLRFLLGESYTVETVDIGGRLLVARSVGGATALIEMAPYSTSLDWQEQALVSFERGWVRLDLPAPLVIDQPGRVTTFNDRKGETPVTQSPTLPPVHAMRQQARHFLQAVRGEETVLSDAQEGLEDLLVARNYLDKITAARQAADL